LADLLLYELSLAAVIRGELLDFASVASEVLGKVSDKR